MSDSDNTDNEYNSDYDDDENYNHIMYEPEENNSSKFTIALNELYNDNIHGEGGENISNQYLVHSRYKKLDINFISDIANNINLEYQYLGNQSHNIYRNYKQIITQENYVKPEITECITLNTGHCIGIIKTIWLKLIQRKWKNIMKERKNIIKKRTHPKSLQYRETTGKWPKNCLKYPQLKGMLSQLNN